jgi:ribonuclease D
MDNDKDDNKSGKNNDDKNHFFRALRQKALSKPIPQGLSGAPREYLRREPQRPLFWIEEEAALEAVLLKLFHETFVGLDVETTLTTQSMCLMQLATPSATYLIDVLALRSLSPLAVFLESRKTKKLIHNAPFEERVLAACGLPLAGVVDTLHLSRRLRGRSIPGGHSLSVVCARELGKPLDKTEQTSNWKRRPLSQSQIIYAALDAEVLLKLWEVFSRGDGF